MQKIQIHGQQEPSEKNYGHSVLGNSLLGISVLYQNFYQLYKLLSIDLKEAKAIMLSENEL